MHRLFVIIVLSVVSILPVVQSVAQDQQETPFVPASPDAVGISRVGNTAVNLYTGTPDISIPLYTLQSRKLQHSLSLQYQGQAIKVQDLAGMAGLGWVLQAGGAITRTTRGRPDEWTNGYAGVTNPKGDMVAGDIYTDDFKELVHNVGAGLWDGEPDVFMSTAGGKFIINGSKQATFIKPAGYDIIQNGLYNDASGARQAWIIADPYGNKYYFGTDTTSTETLLHTGGDLSGRRYVTAWYLDKIVSADGADSITFDYTIGKSVGYSYYKKIRTEKVYPCGGRDGEVTEKTENLSLMSLGARYLNSIHGTNFEVLFGYEQRRDLAGAMAIKSITIKNSEGKQLKQYVFRYGYFDDASGSPDARLKLATLYTADTAGYRRPLADMTYNENVNLPPRNTVQFDHWGYYNSNTANTSLPPAANKAPDPARTGANMLTRITWRSGGITSYTYEPNTYKIGTEERTGGGMRIASVTNSDPLTGATLSTRYRYRLEDGSSSGLLYNEHPENNYVYKVYLGYPTLSDYPNTGVVDECSGYVNHWNDQTYTELFDMYGVALGYSRVEVENQDNSKEVMRFYDLKDWDDDHIELFYFYSSGNIRSYPLAGRSANFRFGPPFSCQSSYGFMRGLLKEKRILKADGTLLGVSNYDYKAQILSDIKIMGLRTMSTVNFNGRLWMTARYEEWIGLPQLISVKEQAYPGGEPDKVITTFKRFAYSTTDPYLVKEIKESGVAGDSLITRYVYPQDIPRNAFTAAIFYSLYNEHIRALPLEEVHFLERGGITRVTAAALNLYEQTYINNKEKPVFSRKMMLPLQSPASDYQSLDYRGTYDPRYKEVLYFNSYDTKGNVTGYTTKENVIHASLWDNETGSYKLAEVANIRPEQFFYTGFEAMGGYNGMNTTYIRSTGGHTGNNWYEGDFVTWFTPYNNEPCKITYWYKQNGQWKYSGEETYTYGMTVKAREGLDDIRIYPANARMTTYTYEPYVGVTSEMDANGKTLYYEYDDEQRLLLVRNNDRNIIKQYDYGYQVAEAAGLSPCPRAVNNISINRTGPLTWSVSWPAVAGAAGYDLEYRKESDDGWAKVSTTTNSYSLSGLDRVTVYEVRVTAKCSNNQTQPSDILAFRTTNSLMTVSFTLTTGMDPNNHAQLNATLTDPIWQRVSFKWGMCVINTTISNTFQYCYGFDGASHGADSYTQSGFNSGMTSITYNSTHTTPGGNFGYITKIVIYDIEGISPWDIQKAAGENYEFIIQ